MKYARLIYGCNKYNRNNQFANIGDCFQSIAIENLFHLAEIPTNSIIALKREYLSECTEEVILPLQGYFSCIKGLTDIYPIPNNIEPIYIGYHDIFTELRVSKEKVHYLKNHGPVGCRDEKTYQMMCKYGVPAYISGCLTITLPEREQLPTQKKVFLADAPKHIEEYIPNRLKENLEYITQEVEYRKDLTYEENSKLIEKKAAEILNRYRDEASLVITSRLHVAGPCLGMGVPIILARKYFDERYGWLDHYIPFYTPDRFNEIDWNVKAVDISKEKKLLIDLFIHALHGENIDELAACIHQFYIERRREISKTPLLPMVYKRMQSINPRIADFTRETLLQPFTVATARKIVHEK